MATDPYNQFGNPGAVESWYQQNAGMFGGNVYGSGVATGACDVAKAPTVRDIIGGERDRLRREADYLQALLDVLPSKLSEDAGKALVALLVRK